MVFGKRGCSNTWKVIVYFNAAEDDIYTITKQVTKEEAEKCFNSLKKEMLSNSLIIEGEWISHSGEKYLLNKSNIALIRMVDDD